MKTELGSCHVLAGAGAGRGARGACGRDRRDDRLAGWPKSRENR